MAGTSRMSREAHVRICGGLEVRILRSTRRVPRALSSFYKKEVRNSRRDGGRPSKAARQGEALNDLKLLGLRALVVSVEEKAFRETSRMDQ